MQGFSCGTELPDRGEEAERIDAIRLEARVELARLRIP
jgi:hypothetical protein